MKRRLVKLVVFLLLGAIVNVAVAWYCVIWVQLPNPPQQRGVLRAFPANSHFDFWWVKNMRSAFAVRLIAMPMRESHPVGQHLSKLPADSTFVAMYPPWSGWPQRLDAEAADTSNRASVAMRSDSLRFANTQMIDARGWPMLSMQSRWEPSASRATPVGESWSGAIALSPKPPDAPGGRVLENQRAFPLRPIWPGFAINTVFYAVILWLLFVAPFALRRRRRIRRGLCPACAYPVGMGASPVCTECGKPLIKQKAQTQKAEMT